MKLPATLVPAIVVATAAAFWGGWWIPLRGIETKGLSGDWATVAVYAAGSAALLPVAMFRWPELVRGGLALLGAGGFFGLALATWSHGIIVGDVVRVTLLFYLTPIWGTLLAIVVLNESMSPLRWLAIVLGLTGAAVVLGFEGGLPIPRSEGDWMGLYAGIAFALSATFAHKFPEIGGFEKTFVAFALAAVFAWTLAILLPAGGATAPQDVMAALPLLTAATMLWLVPITWALLWAAAHLDPGRVSILLMFEVVTAAVTATWLTDEPFGMRGFAGCVLIIGAGTVEAFDQMRRPS